MAKRRGSKGRLEEFDSLAAVLRAAIDESGKSQRAIAQQIGCSQSILSKWRNGLAQPESADTIRRLADWLGVTPDELRAALERWQPVAVLSPAMQAAVDLLVEGQHALIMVEVKRALDRQDRRHARALRELRRHWEDRLADMERALGLPPGP